jgi:predicted  nucleic acid-binding Zn-ribbon protein
MSWRHRGRDHRRSVAVSEPPTVDVAQAAELTGLSRDAIRARIRRGELEADERDGRKTIPLAELRRRDLLVDGGRYKSARERAESLEAELRTALESRERMEKELADAQEKVRMMWSMAQQRDWKLRIARKRRSRLRWRRRRSTSEELET